MTCTLPLEKLESIQSLCQAANTGGWIQVKDLQRLLGTIISGRPAVALTRAKSRGIQRMLIDHFDGSRCSARKMVCLTKWARQDVQWWLNVEIADCSMSLKSIPIWESSRLATDAMDSAIGSVLEGEVFYKELTPPMLNHQISHKEWLAFELTVTPRLTQLKGKVVTWHVDNTSVRYAWLNSGSVKDIWLCKRVIAMQEKLFLQKTQVIPVYVRSAQHLHADMISRNKVMPDWHLSRQVAERLFHQLGVPEIDLMATANSAQVPVYCSALVEKEAKAIDAFTENWNLYDLAYVFPPPAMIELILNRIFQCQQKTKFIVITPWKMKAKWFPKALSLATETPIRLPLSFKTVVDLANSTVIPVTPSGGKIRFVAWKLTGRDGPKLENCPLGLSRLYSRAGRIRLKKDMDWVTDTTPNIVNPMSWIHLNRLQ